ncbi:Arm DNA-binding domain-containing protein [Mucilaginibacter glaciei]|uniref:Arm DNA-binding domain-containing protein n=1 Tax=Mucilaginibacter glaciei TaxID=2772109 RepID=UPI00374290C8
MYVYLRVTVDGVPKEMSVKRSWEPSRWSGMANHAIGNKEDARAINEYPDVLQNRAYEARRKLIKGGGLSQPWR